MNIEYLDNKILIKDPSHFDIAKTFECGQCFRFDKTERGFEGVAKGVFLSVYQSDEGVVIEGADQNQFESLFYDFFDLGRDYGEIDRLLAQDKVLCDVIPFSRGIRILRQEPFETLISFIISSTNNIPRIKKIVAALCENFGEKKSFQGREYYSFPTAQKLAGLSFSDLAVIRAGFRDKYILDCAKKVASGELSLDAVAAADYETAAKMLMTVKGVGRKVADCTLLFGFGFLQSFPKDVWIKRILNAYYGQETNAGLDFYGYDGIAQQYLFYYARENQVNDITQKV